ncbi:MAG: FeoB-associated Cys-rich membrane protein [Christensenella sp.]|nr:MAG: FeoB-associated Cys-rich membrane protein [Christensenella sp.]
MKPIEIIVILAAVAIVAGVIIASIVRKLKGKPSLGSDCAGCSHAGQCNGKCCSNQGNVDWTELVKQRKAELEAQKAQDGVMPETNANEKKENLDGDNKN